MTKIFWIGLHTEIVLQYNAHFEKTTDHAAIEKEEKEFGPIPEVRQLARDIVDMNFYQIKQEVRQLVADRLAYMQVTPTLSRLIVSKKEGFIRKNQFLG